MISNTVKNVYFGREEIGYFGKVEILNFAEVNFGQILIVS